MPSISVGHIQKKVNSTGVQGYSPDVSADDALLKEPCDIKNPVFILKGSAGNYNYAKWGSRYYWVDKIIPFPNGIIEVHCHLDPLGTYKSDIENSYAFITYAGDSTAWDKFADDPRLAPEVPSENSSNSVDVFGFSMTPDNGTVIMTVFQCGAAGDQGVRTYALSLAEFRGCLIDLTGFLNSERSSTSTTQAVNSIDNAMANITSPYTDDVKAQIASAGYMQNALGKLISGIFSDLAGGGSWRDNILNAVYVPIPKSEFGNLTATMYVGTLNCGSRTAVSPSKVVVNSNSISVPWGSGVSAYPFLRLPKYEQLQIVVMGGYYQTIDGTYLTKPGSGGTLGLESDVTVHSSIDICSGDWSVSINKGNSSNALKLATFSGNCSINITGAIGKGGTGQIMQTLNTIGQFAAGAATGGTVTGLLHAGEGFATSRDYGTGIEEKFNGTSVNGLMSGSCGGGISSMFLSGNLGKADFRGILLKPKIIEDGEYVSYCTEYGYPINSWKKIGSFSGTTVKCSGASVNCSGTQSETAYINYVCNNGIYIEA